MRDFFYELIVLILILGLWDAANHPTILNISEYNNSILIEKTDDFFKGKRFYLYTSNDSIIEIPGIVKRSNDDIFRIFKPCTRIVLQDAIQTQICVKYGFLACMLYFRDPVGKGFIAGWRNLCCEKR